MRYVMVAGSIVVWYGVGTAKADEVFAQHGTSWFFALRPRTDKLSPPKESPMSRYGLVLAVAGTFALAGCASTPEDPNAPQACVTIDNTEGGGAAGRVSLVKDGRTGVIPGEIRRIEDFRGERIRIGQVSMGRRSRECIRRNGLVGDYRIVVEGASSDRIDPALNQNQAPLQYSEIFRLNPGDEVEWNVRLNRIRFISAGT